MHYIHWRRLDTFIRAGSLVEGVIWMSSFGLPNLTISARSHVLRFSNISAAQDHPTTQPHHRRPKRCAELLAAPLFTAWAETQLSAPGGPYRARGRLEAWRVGRAGRRVRMRSSSMAHSLGQISSRFGTLQWAILRLRLKLKHIPTGCGS